MPARGSLALTIVVLLTSTLASHGAHAQRAGEDAVAEAEDAFGISVGRQAIGLYSAGNARGFSPLQAGNLRIDGLYFDQVQGYFTNLTSRVVRGSAVHVGIAAQGYLFPAPTGVVDYQLRAPGNDAELSTLNGVASYSVLYDETDFALPLIRDRLSIGGGVGLSHNATYAYADRSDEWTGGALVRWQPTDSLVITPFWSVTHHIEYGEKPYYISIGDSGGVPRYRAEETQGQPWAGWTSVSQNFGATARLALGRGWSLAAGAFRSLDVLPLDYVATLSGVGSNNQGEYGILAFPANSSGSSSGEVRLTKLFGNETLRHTLYFRVTGRDSSVESGGADFQDIGPGSTTYTPIAYPTFNTKPTTLVQSQQWTPGVAYRAVWRKKAELTLGVQKVFYHRFVLQPQEPAISYGTQPWLFSAAASGSIGSKLVAYASYTRGFENLGIAPVNATNANEPVPSVLTRQIDAGIRYQLMPRLQVIAGVFTIDKPYFNLDQFNLYRMVGTTRNRGAEFSLTGDLTSHLNIVSGIVLLQPRVQYDEGARGGARNVVAIGPEPAYMSNYLQYHPAAFPALTLGASLQLLSSRYAIYPNVKLPSNAILGADARYKTRLLGQDASFWLRINNLTDTYNLTPSASGQVSSLDGRRFDFSLVIDF